MNRATFILAGAALLVLASLGGLVLAPGWQQRALAPVSAQEAGGPPGQYPAPDDALVALGRATYRAEGCIYCHSQQVRPEGFGADQARGWGSRRSVPRDYVLQAVPLLGTMRTGPDLANIGARQPSDDWHHVHLYDARLVSPGSVMPPLGYLYTVRDTPPPPGAYAVALPAAGGGPRRWLVPGPEALALVAYLKGNEQRLPLAAVK